MNEIVVDLHLHSHTLLPPVFNIIYRFFNRKTIPPLFKINDIKLFDINLYVIAAVGDSIVTNLYWRKGYSAVKKQLKTIIKLGKSVNAIIYDDHNSIKEALETKRPLIMLAVEGGDFINNKLERVKELYNLGVKVLTIVHSEDNCIGHSTVKLTELIKKNKKFEKKENQGLTIFGRSVIEEMNSLGMIIDLAHSNYKTIMDVCEISCDPVISSHTGAKALQPKFPRYLDDAEIKAIAQTGGVIGVWPFYFDEFGAKNMEEFKEHFRYIKDLVGSKHLGFGSDINGVPGITTGFNYPTSFLNLCNDLQPDFSREEINGIMGNNFITVLKMIER